MGLLDKLFQGGQGGEQDPNTPGMLGRLLQNPGAIDALSQLASGIIASQAPSLDPGAGRNAFAQGVAGAGQAWAAHKQNQPYNDLLSARAGEIQSEQDRRSRLIEGIQAAMGAQQPGGQSAPMDPSSQDMYGAMPTAQARSASGGPDMRALAEAMIAHGDNPMAGVEMLMPQGPSYQEVGGHLVDTSAPDGPRTAWSAPEKPRESDATAYADSFGFQRGTPEWGQKLAQYRQLGGTSITNSPLISTAQARQTGAEAAYDSAQEEITGARNTALAANEQNTRLDTLSSQLAQAPAGVFANAQVAGSQFLGALGFNVDQAAIDSAVQSRAGISSLVLDFMGSQTGGARGFTEKETQILVDAFPKLNTDATARQSVIDVIKSANQRKIDAYNRSARSRAQSVYELTDDQMNQYWPLIEQQQQAPNAGGGIIRYDAQGNPL